jgi:hypothetical protein
MNDSQILLMEDNPDDEMPQPLKNGNVPSHVTAVRDGAAALDHLCADDSPGIPPPGLILLDFEHAIEGDINGWRASLSGTRKW